jgi:hypothetical protein
MSALSRVMQDIVDDGPFEAPAPARGLEEAFAPLIEPLEAPSAAEEGGTAAPGPPIGFARLRALLSDTRPFADEANRRKAGRLVRRAVHSAEFEMAVLDGALSPVWRLRQLCELQLLVVGTDLRHREQEDLLVELDRAGMRILWSARIVQTVLDTQSPPENRAAALLFLIADGVLPSGACAKSALEPAKQLLQTEEALTALKSSPLVRHRIVELLMAAERKPMI